MKTIKFELVRLFSKPSTYIVLVVLPIVFVIVGGAFFNLIGTNNLKIGVYNLDKTPLARFTVGVIMSLFQGGTVTYVGDDYETKLKKGELHAVVVIPKGFSSSLFAGEKTHLRYVPSPVDTHLSVAAFIVFRKLFEDLGGGPFFSPKVLQQMYVSQSVPAPELVTDAHLNFSQAFAPSLTMIIVMLVGLITASSSIVEDKDQRLFQLYMLSNTKSLGYLIPKFVVSALVAVSSGLVAYAVFVLLGFRASPSLVVSLILLNGLFHTSLGMLISSLSPSLVVANLISYGLGFLLFLASGALTSMAVLPEALRKAVRLLPVNEAIYLLRLAQFFPGANLDKAILQNTLAIGVSTLLFLGVTILSVFRQFLPAEVKRW